MAVAELMQGGTLKGPCILGIDEAGRGPVLGPMVYAAAWWAKADDKAVSAEGYDDSKALSEEKRESLYGQILADARVGAARRTLHAEELSTKMLCGGGKINLNTLSHNAAIELIQLAVDNEIDVVEAYVDTVGKPETYKDKLQRAFPTIKFTVCAKADSLYRCVSAASIVAKVTRDRVLKNWEFVEGNVDTSVPWGSGYPGDPVTKTWLRQNLDPVFGFPSLVRFSWQTTKTLLDDFAIQMLWECEREENEKGRLSTKEAVVPLCETQTTGTKRHAYFRSRRLQRVRLE